MPPPSFMHMVVTGRIGYRIADFVVERNLDFIYGPEAATYIERGPDTVRAADYALIARACLPDPLPERGYIFGVVPDLVVVSPDYRASVVDAKTRMWLDAGARLVLVVCISTREVIAHRDDGAAVWPQ